MRKKNYLGMSSLSMGRITVRLDAASPSLLRSVKAQMGMHNIIDHNAVWASTYQTP